MSRMASTKTAVDLDLDKELGFADDEPSETKKVRLLGREWTLVCDLNSFTIAQIVGGDTSAVSGFIIGLIAEDEQEDFGKALMKAKNMTGERLGLLLQKLIEAAGERPTEPPSPSRRTAKKPTSSLKSAGT